ITAVRFEARPKDNHAARFMVPLGVREVALVAGWLPRAAQLSGVGSAGRFQAPGAVQMSREQGNREHGSLTKWVGHRRSRNLHGGCTLRLICLYQRILMTENKVSEVDR
ncbi:unnamed protein product, partial [Hapterophycus canaliculatus]